MTADGGVTAMLPAATRWPRSRVAAAIAVAILAALVGGAGGYRLARDGDNDIVRAPLRATLILDENINPRAPSQRFAISPDGRRLAYVAADGSDLRVRLWLRSLDGLTAQPLPGTDGAIGPFWSPDSRFVAFFAGGELKKIDIGGGPPVSITSGGAANFTSAGTGVAVQGMPGSWNEQGVILFSDGRALLRVPASGGTPTAVTTLKDGETVHDFPHFLPGGTHFVFAAYKGQTPAGTYVGSLDGTAPVRLMDDSSNAQYANGFLLFIRGTSLMAQRFEPASGLNGDPTPLVDAVLANLTARPASAFTVSQAGALLYQTAQGYGGSRLVWSTRQGVHTPIHEEAMSYRDLQLSPDGTRLAYVRLDERGRSDQWVLHLARGARTRLSFRNGAQAATWSPDGRALIFSPAADEAPIRKAADGSGGEHPVPGDAAPKLPFDWSPDGQTLLYETFSSSTSNDLWALRLDGTGSPTPVAVTSFSERWPQFSPDGRFVAYTSDESGTRELYVTRFGGSGRWQVSSAGGSYPRWSHDGRELYFFSPNGKINAVSVTVVGDAIETGR